MKGAANEYDESDECGTSVQNEIVSNLDQRQRAHNQSITRLGEMSACIHGMHRKAALTTIYQPFNFRSVDDRKDWLNKI
jgi:hypothetical protein